MLEMEEQRQRESREFQLQMITLLKDSQKIPILFYHPMYSFADDVDNYQ